MSFKGNGFCFETGKRTYIMGVLNITPDSFYDGGRYNSIDRAVSHLRRLEMDGADIIDVGANSTNPEVEILSVKDELKVIGDMLPEIIKATAVPVSVDTFYPEVARFALESGAKIINDVSGIINPEMLKLIKKHKAGYTVMHNPLFSSKEAADYTECGGVANSVEAFFENCEKELENAGISKEQVLFDIGIGFSKNQFDDNELLKNMSTFRKEGRALLVALSNKRVTSVLPDMTKADRLYSTIAYDTLAIAGGADFIRVHNVREAKIAAEAADRIVR
ncbi:MAG: dihydropteroate synthase [Clostridiaceae bacterium]|nr:dihydropteroate synthase [Clostridiaceae bacterium]